MNTILILSLAGALNAGLWQVGTPFYAPPSTRGLWHHSGCLGSNKSKRPKTRRLNPAVSQAKVRKNRRRAHAAGVRHAFA